VRAHPRLAKQSENCKPFASGELITRGRGAYHDYKENPDCACVGRLRRRSCDRWDEVDASTAANNCKAMVKAKKWPRRIGKPNWTSASIIRQRINESSLDPGSLRLLAAAAFCGWLAGAAFPASGAPTCTDRAKASHHYCDEKSSSEQCDAACDGMLSSCLGTGCWGSPITGKKCGVTKK
jgi:hypothetical protein